MKNLNAIDFARSNEVEQKDHILSEQFYTGVAEIYAVGQEATLPQFLKAAAKQVFDQDKEGPWDSRIHDWHQLAKVALAHGEKRTASHMAKYIENSFEESDKFESKLHALRRAGEIYSQSSSTIAIQRRPLDGALELLISRKPREAYDDISTLGYLFDLSGQYQQIGLADEAARCRKEAVKRFTLPALHHFTSGLNYHVTEVTDTIGELFVNEHAGLAARATQRVLNVIFKERHTGGMAIRLEHLLGVLNEHDQLNLVEKRLLNEDKRDVALAARLYLAPIYESNGNTELAQQLYTELVTDITADADDVGNFLYANYVMQKLITLGKTGYAQQIAASLRSYTANMLRDNALEVALRNRNYAAAIGALAIKDKQYPWTIRSRQLVRALELLAPGLDDEE
jgi:hypothetical protein